MRLLRQYILKILVLTNIRLKEVQVPRCLRSEDHTFHSVEAMNYVRNSGPHISYRYLLLPKVARHT